MINFSETIVITASQRQAQYLRLNKSYPQAKIIAWPDFLYFSWQTWQQHFLTESFTWLDNFRQKLLWEKLILKNPLKDFEGQLSLLCSALQDTWKKITLYQIPLDTINNSFDKNQSWLYQMMKVYQQALQQEQLIDDVSWLQLFVNQLDQASNLPKQWRFYGFLEETPLQKNLQTFLEQQNYQVTIDTPWQFLSPGSISRLPCNNPEQEIDAMMTWLKNIDQTNKKIALIIPNLAEQKTHLAFQLNKIFKEKCWHFSLAEKLNQFAVIDTALILLNLLANNTITFAAFESLIRSPYWGSNIISKKQNYLKQLRALCWDEINLAILTQETNEESNLFSQAASLLTFKNALPSEWTLLWQQQLAILLWSSNLEQDTKEEKTIIRFQEALVEFSQLDQVLGKLSFASALMRLKQFIEPILFDPQPQPEASIQIIGLLEAAGMTFDAAWLSSADKRFWPPTAKTNFLLPIPLQKRYGLYTDTQHKLFAEKTLFDAISHCSQNLVISYPLEVDGQSTELSDRLAALPIATIAIDSIINDSLVNETSSDKLITGLPITMNVNEAIYGGSGALKSQSACAFQAYARFRLQATTLPEAAPYITAIERGIMLHNALQIIWQRLKTQTALLQMPEEELQKLIAIAAKLSLRQIKINRRRLLAKTLISFEITRLKKLLFDWLMLEKQREPFTVIATESAAEVQFANALWRIRIDRIDQLQDGKIILFDYKTGLISTKNAWQEERLSEPQLPFYALTHPTNAQGIAFAILRAEHLKIMGIAETAEKLGSLGELFANNSWQEQLQSWQNNLQQLANDYLQGVAYINPRDENVCLFCDLASFCRIYL